MFSTWLPMRSTHIQNPRSIGLPGRRDFEGSGWLALKRTNSPYDKHNPQLYLGGGKIYYKATAWATIRWTFLHFFYCEVIDFSDKLISNVTQ